MESPVTVFAGPKTRRLSAPEVNVGTNTDCTDFKACTTCTHAKNWGEKLCALTADIDACTKPKLRQAALSLAALSHIEAVQQLAHCCQSSIAK
jgi:hypothetical protein